MAHNKGLLSGLLNDEIRNMSESVRNTTEPDYNNYKYTRHITRPQTIKENLGILYNDDSMAQFSVSSNKIEDNLINTKGIANFEPEQKYIIISGEDRPWYLDNNSENTFNFHVDCGDISLINDNQSSTANIRHSLENIVSIFCDGIIIPNRLLDDNSRPSSMPYIQLTINDIESASYGTNKSLDTTLAVLTPKLPLPNTLQEISYLEFKNANKQVKTYNTPKLRLNKLAISLKRYDGESLLTPDLAANRDILHIKTIYYDNVTNKLLIETLEYFSPINFREDDLIKFNNYRFRETDLDFSECHEFNKFINRTRGHYIIATSMNNTDTDIVYDNVIEIDYPRYVNKLTGKYELEPWFASLLNKTSIDSNLENDNAGKLINTSLQIQILLTLTSLNKNSSILVKNIDIK
jgi:hypothetical protein